MCLFSKLRTNILNPYYAIAELNKIVNGTLEYDCTKLTGRISFIRTFGVQVPTTMTSATRTTILLTMLTSIRSGNYRKR